MKGIEAHIFGQRALEESTGPSASAWPRYLSGRYVAASQPGEVSLSVQDLLAIAEACSQLDQESAAVYEAVFFQAVQNCRSAQEKQMAPRLRYQMRRPPLKEGSLWSGAIEQTPPGLDFEDISDLYRAWRTQPVEVAPRSASPARPKELEDDWELDYSELEGRAAAPSVSAVPTIPKRLPGAELFSYVSDPDEPEPEDS